MRSVLAVAFTLFAAPALAQEPQGIGFAQAEEGTWLCRHERPDEALSCARELCAEQSPGQTCSPTAWCLPAKWSGVMTIWLPDFHTTRVLCGAPSETALSDALRALCAGDAAATHCDLTLVVDPEGNERTVEGVSFVGPAAQPLPAATGEADPLGGPSAGEPLPAVTAPGLH
jgi:hypothetical protein